MVDSIRNTTDGINPGAKVRLIGTISYLGACYIRTTVTKCIREKMTHSLVHFRT